MNVLHLPVNVASHLSTTVRGLREIGVDARGFVVYGASPTRDDAGVERLSSAVSRRSLRWWRDALPELTRLIGEIRRADAVHWFMTPALPGAVDLHFAARLGKPSIVEFAGGDIRNPAIESADNSYYAEMRPHYEYRGWETERNSHRTQALFARAGCEALVSCPSLLDYLEPGRFAHVHLVRQRVMVSDFDPRYPDPHERLPLVVHASTAPVGKGTPAVVAAVERLRGRVDFDFVLLDRVPRAEALATIARADVYLDQFVIGSHGSAAVEAMALGKPVVGYVKPSLVERYPADLPIVNASQEDLPHVLEELLRDGPRRHELGVRSRRYAEEHHDAVRLAWQLHEIYVRLLRARGSSSSRAAA